MPLPPKVKKEPSNVERKDSKEKSSGDVLTNKSNIFSSLENKSSLLPRSRKNSQDKLSRVRLPSIGRKNSCNES